MHVVAIPYRSDKRLIIGRNTSRAIWLNEPTIDIHFSFSSHVKLNWIGRLEKIIRTCICLYSQLNRIYTHITYRINDRYFICCIDYSILLTTHDTWIAEIVPRTIFMSAAWTVVWYDRFVLIAFHWFWIFIWDHISHPANIILWMFIIIAMRDITTGI